MMKLPFFSQRPQVQKKYLGLLLKEDNGVAIIIGDQTGRMRTIDEEKFNYSNGWDNLTQDVDEAIFRLEQKLKIRVEETIFFVYSHFIDEKVKNLKKLYLQKIKEMVKNLELKALGYIECYEAVVDYLEKKEEMPLTAIVVELDPTNLSIFIYKGGKPSYSWSGQRSASLTQDLLESFEGLKGKFLLPSRIILYNTKDLDDESSKILSYRWSEDYFVQIPRVEIIKEEEVIQGLVSVFANQLSAGEVSPGKVATDKKDILGFVIGEDITTEVELPIKKSFLFDPKPILERLSKIFSYLKFSPEIRLPEIKLPKELTIIIGIFSIILALFLNEYFFHKASLTLFLPSQSINQSVAIAAVTSEITGDLKVNVATQSVELSSTVPTTGKRDVGDRARGEVTLYSFDDKEKIFNKGTTIAVIGLTFLLDDEVKVASASISTTNENVPGKTKAKISAIDIGPQYNISKNKRFKIDDLSPTIYFAINENAFSGGTKREVRTISKNDIDDVKTNISEKAKTNSSQNPSGVKAITDLSRIDLTDLKFSGEVGEEADSISLKAKINSTNYLYDEQQLLNKLESLLKKDIKAGYKILRERLTYKIDKIDKREDRINLKLAVSASLIKDISKVDVLKKIAGTTKNNLKAILKTNFDAQGYEVNIYQPLPLFGERLPFLKKNINLIISSLD